MSALDAAGARAAAELMFDRIEATRREDAAGFPEYAAAADPAWARSADGTWCGGFWVGQLWLAAAVGHGAGTREDARAHLLALEPQAELDSVFRGFIFWYGAALGEVLLGDEAAAEAARRGAAGLAASRNPVAGLVPAGTGGSWSSPAGAHEAWIDGVPGVTPLLHRAGGKLAPLGLQHAASTLELCLRDDGTVAQVAAFDPLSGELRGRRNPNGWSDESTWSRAQAWALLGLAQAARRDPERFAAPARRLADAWLERLPDGAVAPWDFDHPEAATTWRDTSAAAIAAAALLKVATFAPDGERYAEGAGRIAAALVADHLSSGDPPGRLLDGCYNGRKGFAVDAELIWGNYFLLEALLGIAGLLDTAAL